MPWVKSLYTLPSIICLMAALAGMNGCAKSAPSNQEHKTSASPPDSHRKADCYLNNLRYSHGARAIVEGKECRCVNGTWTPAN